MSSTTPPEGASPLALARVPFRGGFILAASGPVEGEGNRPVPLAPFCEALGIDTDTQARKLRGKPWACPVIMTAQIPGDDQARRVFCIPLRALPMWLATIHPGKVAPSARPMLEAFQAEACDVLYRHFAGGPSTGLGVLETQAAEVARLRGQMASLAADADELKRKLAAVGRGLVALGGGEVSQGAGRRARASAPGPRTREFSPERGADAAWNIIQRRGMERVTAGQLCKWVRALRRMEDALAAFAVLVARGLVEPCASHHGHAFQVVRVTFTGPEGGQA